MTLMSHPPPFRLCPMRKRAVSAEVVFFREQDEQRFSNTQPTSSVYLLFDKDAKLLYVGVTDCFQNRMDGHIRTKPWWGDVAGARFEHFPNRIVAEERERYLIKTMDPPYNSRDRAPAPDMMAGRLMRSKKLPETLVAKAVESVLNDDDDI